MINQRIDRWMAGATLVLAVVLAGQLVAAHRVMTSTGTTLWVADWAENPESLEEALASAEQVVVGQVSRVRAGEDLVVQVEGEPGGEDRIPTEIVTLRVERSLKSAGGGAPTTIELFRTGATKGTPPSRLGNRPPEDPPAGVERPARPTPPSDRTVKLTGDPPYERGERYVLMLKAGPQMRVDGQSVQTQRPVSPEGRYRVDRRGQIEPMSERARFAQELRGRSLEAFEEQIRRGVGPNR